MKFSIIKEFKDFAVKGNMVDLAIGVIIGASFNKVIDVLVKEVLLPPLSLLTDGGSWENKKWVLRDSVTTSNGKEIEEIAIGYGKLFEVFTDFLIIGFTVFLVVRAIHSLKTKAENPKDKTVKTPKDIELLDRLANLVEEQNRLMSESLNQLKTK